jgi:hypothetical protein
MVRRREGEQEHRVAERGDLEPKSRVVGGEMVNVRSVKVSRYWSMVVELRVGAPGEPEPHPYFHRSVADLPASACEVGFCLDGVEEPVFPPNAFHTRPLAWSNDHELPPVVVFRLRVENAMSRGAESA